MNRNTKTYHFLNALFISYPQLISIFKAQFKCLLTKTCILYSLAVTGGLYFVKIITKSDNVLGTGNKN